MYPQLRTALPKSESYHIPKTTRVSGEIVWGYDTYLANASISRPRIVYADYIARPPHYTAYILTALPDGDPYREKENRQVEGACTQFAPHTVWGSRYGAFRQ